VSHQNTSSASLSMRWRMRGRACSRLVPISTLAADLIARKVLEADEIDQRKLRPVGEGVNLGSHGDEHGATGGVPSDNVERIGVCALTCQP
jgi:hypothetical protein